MQSKHTARLMPGEIKGSSGIQGAVEDDASHTEGVFWVPCLVNLCLEAEWHNSFPAIQGL